MGIKLPIPWGVIKLIVQMFVPEPYKSILLAAIDYIQNLPLAAKQEAHGEFSMAQIRTKETGDSSHLKAVVDKHLDRCFGGICAPKP